MLLAPQHFQQLAQRAESLLHWRSMLATPYQWGIKRLTYDTALLLNGRFRVLELEALMPDGLVVALRRGGSDDLEIDLTQYEQELQDESLTIHLVVPALRTGANSVDGDLARYDSVLSDPIVDDNTGEDGIEVPYLRPRAALIVSNAPPSRFVTIPLAKVIFKNGLYSLTDYIWPTLCVTHDSQISEICRAIATCLREKSMYLSEDIRAHHYDMGPSEVLKKKSEIQSLVEGLPYLEAILNTGIAHPFSLYLALCLICGHVAALGETYVPPVFPVYDHNDLRKTFQFVYDFIMTAVEQGIWEEYLVIAFTLKNDVFSRRIEPMWIEGPLIIGVRGAPRISQREVSDWIDASLIGSASVMQSMRERRILGATRRKRDEDHQHVATRGLLLYEIMPEREFVRPSEDLQIQNLNDGGGLIQEIVLFVRNERRR